MSALATDFAAALDADAELVDTGEGYSRLNISWADGENAKLDIHDDHADWKHLSHLRLMKVCHQAARKVLLAHGIGYLLCGALDQEARKALDKNGDWYEIDTELGPRLRWDLVGD